MSLIRNSAKATRGIDFSNMTKPVNGDKSKVYMTDIDGITEIDDKFLIIIEIKEDGKDLSIGQEILLKRLVNAWKKSGPDKRAVAIFAQHDPEALGDIPAYQCDVVSVCVDGHKFVSSSKMVTVGEYFQQLVDNWDIKKLK